MISKTLNSAIISEVTMPGAEGGLLTGYRFVAKDICDIAGYVTGVGNPDWQRTHMPASVTASAIATLVDAGATLVGKTLMDELAFSIDGVNVHYGTPVNPQYPDRVTGGSSSGSASAVAAKLVEFALGTDTGGSVRIPASYCGIYGFRPSHGSIPTDGVVPLAPSFDTVGWFARKAEILKNCGCVLLKESEPESSKYSTKLLIAQDAFTSIHQTLKPAMQLALSSVADQFASVEDLNLSKFGWEDYLKHFRIIQGWEAWKCHGEWITKVQPSFDPLIKERFEFASKVKLEDYDSSLVFRENLIIQFDSLLSDRTVLCMPTTYNLPPLRNATADDLLHNRSQNIKLTCVAALGCLPQVSVPIKVTDTTSTGLSFLAARGNDILLLDLSEKLSQLL